METRYHGIKPIARGQNKGKIPVGKRARSWEEIIKREDNTFLMYGFYQHGEEFITWMKNKKTGGVGVRVRNHGHQSGYRFLERVMPHGLEFNVNQNSHHTVSVHATDNYAARHIISAVHHYDCLDSYYIPDHNDYRYGGEKVDQSLMFFHVGNKQWRIAKWSTIFDRPRLLVDKAKKKEYREVIEKFYDDFVTYVPMLHDQTDHGTASRASMKIYDNVTKGGQQYRYRGVMEGVYGDEYRFDFMTILLHEMFEHGAGYWDGDKRRWIKPTAMTVTRQEFRARFNRWINSFCQFSEWVTTRTKYVGTNQEKTIEMWRGKA
jgi:hypothetical protein